MERVQGLCAGERAALRGSRVAAAVVAALAGILTAGVAGRPTSAAEPTGAGIRKLSFPPPAEMVRADLYTLDAVAAPRAVLVLCPGFNESGEGFLRQPAWQEFARANRLALCAISFASPGEETLARRGYYHAARGSGGVLLNGVRRSFGRDLPILIYGFSGGAHFTASLVNWQPDRVLGWCADSAAWWEEPRRQPGACPPGIVACGDEDAGRYGASLTFFAQGRALGLPWTWVSLRGIGHVRSEPLDGFVRAYFAALLSANSKLAPVRPEAAGVPARPAGGWRDVDTKGELSASQAGNQPTLASWLPAASLGPLWCGLHQP